MRVAFRLFLFVIITAFFCTCGAKSAKRINLVLDFKTDPASKFYSDSNVLDVLYYIEDLTNTARGTLFYPRPCVDSNLEAGCGFKPDEEVNLKLCFEACGGDNSVYIEPENNIKLIFCARNAEGKVIYKGESEQFKNDPAAFPSQIPITICEASPALNNCLESLPVVCE